MNDTVIFIVLLIVAIGVPVTTGIIFRKREHGNILLVAICTLLTLALFYVAVETRLYDPLSIIKKTSWFIPMVFGTVSGIIGLWKGKHVFLTITLLLVSLVFPLLYLFYAY